MARTFERRWLSSAIAVAVALALFACVETDRQPNTWTALGYAGWPQFHCDKTNSVLLTAETFLKTPETYSGQCVLARGFTQSGRFYGTLESLYGYLGRDPPEHFFDNEIGLDTFDLGIMDLVNGRHFVEVVAFAETYGAVSSRQFDEAEEKNILLFPMAGWCHWSSGPVLFVAQIEAIDAIPLRLYGQEAARQYGTIVDMEEAWADAEEARSIIEEWYEAARAQEFERVNIRHEEDISKFVGRASPLGFLFDAPEIPTIKYLRVAGIDEAFREDGGASVPGLGAYGCLCKAENCEGQWPIILEDALTEGPWPYYCILIWQRLDEEGRAEMEIAYPSSRRLY